MHSDRLLQGVVSTTAAQAKISGGGGGEEKDNSLTYIICHIQVLLVEVRLHKERDAACSNKGNSICLFNFPPLPKSFKYVFALNLYHLACQDIFL